MLNKIWFWLLCIGIVYAFAKAGYQTAFPSPNTPPTVDRKTDLPALGFTAMGKRLNEATLDAATTSVEICIGLIGIMALWLGLLRIAQDSGLVDAFARLLRPVMRWLFPEIPDGHPAQGAMLMNMSANMLGLDNAATPLGLKAMTELQQLNPVKDTATNSMAMFLAINNSSLTIIPFTIIGYRALKGSANAAEPLAATLLVTSITTLTAIFAVRCLSRRPAYQLAADPLPNPLPQTNSPAEAEKNDD